MSKYEGHTPGPWKIHRYDTEYPSFWIRTIPDEFDFDDEVAEVFDEANARLIADAPALLAENVRLRAALVDLLEVADSIVENTPELDPVPIPPGIRERAARALGKE